MKKERSEEELFEKMPVPKAVATLAVLTIIGQIVTMIYNLADTFFVGQMGNPYMVAAVSLVSPWFNLLTALGNLFGLGGGITTLLFSLLTYLFRHPLLSFLGASSGTYGYAQSYLLWVVVLGGVPTMLSLTMGNLLRSEGHARQASIGMMFGGILNVVLDPVLIFGFHLDVAGAAIATACSNLASVVCFIVIYLRLKKRTAVSLRPNYFSFRFIRQIFSVGLASALATTLGNASNMVIIKLAAGYGDIPVAAYGIVKRIDQFPLNISMGLCQGFMPLVGYNFASGNYKRMREVSFLRIACIAVPFTSANFLISYTLQAMGKGMQSAILTFSRQGLLNIPLLIFMDFTVGLYGMIWTQLIVELVMLPISLGMYKYTFRHLKRQ